MTGSNSGQTGGIYTSSKCLNEILFSTFIGLACYNAIELIVLCFTRFKRWSGTYFWSILIASTSIPLYCLGLLLKFFNIAHNDYIGTHILVTIGWCGMVTGQSMVLWSRLHLLLLDPRIIRGSLYLIIVNAVILHIPTATVALGTNTPSHPVGFARAYTVIERIQVIGFCAQETFLSSLYIWGTLKHLRYTGANHYRYILHELLLINVIIIVLDGSVVGIEFAGLYALQITYKPLVYSIKLKLEFAILRKLVKVTTAPRPERPLQEDRHKPKTKHRFVRLFPCDVVRAGMPEPSAAPPPEPSRVLSTTTTVLAKRLRTLGEHPPAKE